MNQPALASETTTGKHIGPICHWFVYWNQKKDLTIVGDVLRGFAILQVLVSECGGVKVIVRE